MFIEDCLYLHNKKILHFDFSDCCSTRSSPDCGLQIIFTKDKTDFDFDNYISYIAINKEFNHIKILNPIPINSYGLPSIRNLLNPLYSSEIEITDELIEIFTLRYNSTRYMSFNLFPTYYHSNIFSDYQLALKGIEIGGYGNSIFLFISFVEKVFKSYLRNIDSIKNDEKFFRHIGHNIITAWTEVKNRITLHTNFDKIYFYNTVIDLYNLYQADLRYDNGRYKIENAIKANDLSLELIDYFLNNTEHILVPDDFDWLTQ